MLSPCLFSGLCKYISAIPAPLGSSNFQSVGIRWMTLSLITDGSVSVEGYRSWITPVNYERAFVRARFCLHLVCGRKKTNDS